MLKQNLEVSRLFVQPLKSGGMIELCQAEITATGLAYDRNWMLINNKSGKFISQRDPGMEKLALIAVNIHDGKISFSSEKIKSSLELPVEGVSTTEPSRVCYVHGTLCYGFDQGDQAANWFNESLGLEAGTLRLVRYDESYKRWVKPDLIGYGRASTAFSDGAPFLMITEESHNAVNSLLAEQGHAPRDVKDWRPNIVVKGAEQQLEPFAEDLIVATELLQSGLGNFSFEWPWPCSRCKVPGISQDSGRSTISQLSLKKAVNQIHPLKAAQSARDYYMGINGVADYRINETTQRVVLAVGSLMAITQIRDF